MKNLHRKASKGRFSFIGFSVLFLLLLCSMFLVTEAQAKVVIKLGTIAPKGSPWYDSLKKMGEEWKKASDGEVVLKIYAGGVLGNENAMVRKLRQGRLQAATLTSLGIRLIDSTLLTVQCPRLIQTTEEIDLAMKYVVPEARKRLKEKGFVLVQQGDAGWVRLFTKEKITTLEELQKVKVFVAASEPETKKAWRGAGFNTVEIPSTEVLPALQTGLLDGFGATPLVALAMQWFGIGKYMIAFKWAPLIGGTVVSAKVWQRIPDKYRDKLFEIAQKYSREDLIRIRNMDDKALETMKKHGLEVVEWREAEKKKMHDAIVSQWGYITGKLIPKELFDVVKKKVEEHRAAEK